MGTKTVKWDGQTRDMKGVPDKNPHAIQGEDSGALTKEWNKRVISHADAEILHLLVRYEGQYAQEHMVGCPGISNNQALCVT
jgi:hypothetical protein